MSAKLSVHGVYIWMSLWKTTRAVEENALRHIESLGLCISDFAVCECLLHKGPLPVNEIGGAVLLTSGSITTAVDRLEEKKFVIRKNHKTDRRVRVVHLTAAGKKMISRAFTEHKKAMEQVMRSIPSDERRKLMDILKKIRKGAKDNLK